METISEPFVDIEDRGDSVGEINVTVNYRIINLFSGQLYSSPYKAIEELVCNAYDAFAENCHILLNHRDFGDYPGFVAVWDDGESMDPGGLDDLWSIARQKSRTSKDGRRQIGKFGIGKLSTYVIGRRVTYLCKTLEGYHSVTMDYEELESRSEGEGGANLSPLPLDVRQLTKEEAKNVAEIILEYLDDIGAEADLFGAEASDSWTLVIVDGLKEDVKEIKEGPLHWIISSALPINPTFSVYRDGNHIEPSTKGQKKLKSWTIGDDDDVADDLGLRTGTYENHPAVFIPDTDGEEYPIWGEFDLYEDTITTGKSQELQRNEGFFIRVRGRLLNEQDESFGLPNLSYQIRNRLHAEVHANRLDEYLTANRESVTDNPWLRKLRRYLRNKFNKVRNFYKRHRSRDEEETEEVGEKVDRVPDFLLRFPVEAATERVLALPDRSGYTIKVDEKPDHRLHPITDVQIDNLGSEAPLSIYNASDGVITLNDGHPLARNYIDEEGEVDDVLWIVGVAEVVLEAYLHEANTGSDKAIEVMKTRDEFLRELVSRKPRGARKVAQDLRDATEDKDALERALHLAFRKLGFRVSPKAGNGEPEGIAVAPIPGSPGDDDSEVHNDKWYTFTYEAKSTTKKRVPAKDLNLSGVADHKSNNDADYAVVVAKDFAGRDDEDPKAEREAEEQGVTLIRAADLAKLVEISALQAVPLEELRELFELRRPDDAAGWIAELEQKTPDTVPLRELIETLWEAQEEEVRMVNIDALRFYREGRKGPLADVEHTQIKQWFETLQRLVPEFVTVRGDRLCLGAAPHKVLEHAEREIGKLRSRSPGNRLAEALGIPTDS